MNVDEIEIEPINNAAEEVSNEPSEIEPSTQSEEVVEESSSEEPTFDDRLSSQFAELKRRERELNKERQNMKHEIESQVKKALEDITSDPVNKLQAYGLTADQLTEGILGRAPESPEEMTRKEIEELKAWKEQQERAKQEAEQARIIKDYQNEIFSFVSKDEGKYKLINTFEGGKDLLWNTIAEYHREYGQAPDLSEISERVEKHLFDHVKKVASYVPSEAPPKEVKEAVASKSKESPFTISSKHSSYRAPKVRTVDQNQPIQVRSSVNQAQEEAKRKLLEKFDLDKFWAENK